MIVTDRLKNLSLQVFSRNSATLSVARGSTNGCEKSSPGDLRTQLENA